MSLETGTRLGLYEIISPLGAGGMGEVYRARDTKLDREVAIKVLPEELSRDKERWDRFEREARLLAQLNHPNIATLYGLEESSGKQVLVMELVEGETLAQRIAKGPIAPDESLRIFRQIALGLEAAHEKSIIHRDLKPANIKITPEGNVKILDFGLAKPFREDSLGLDASQSPTLTKETALGTIMGTASYMSPEQARGKPVDKRTDIWAFGCCFYEALTARSTFTGESVADVISSVLGVEPDWSALPAGISPKVRTLVARCLRKNAAERLRDVGDARIEIDDCIQNPAADPVVSAGATAARPRLLRALALVLALVATFYFARTTTPPSLSTATAARFSIALPPGYVFPINLGTLFFALSPDGSRLAYAAHSGGRRELYVRVMDEFDARRIPGTEDAEAPFFSPDGRRVGFFRGNEIQTVPVSGGPPVTVCNTPVVNRPSAYWSEDDRIVFSSDINASGGLQSVDAAGGAPEPLANLDSAEGDFWQALPQLLPGGKSVLVTVSTDAGPRLAAFDLETRARRVFEELGDAVGGRYAATGHLGHLLYAQSGVLMAVPFDAGRLELRGEPRVILERLHTSLGSAFFSVSNSGALAFLPSSMFANRLVLVDRIGRAEPITDDPSMFQHPKFSPDGTRMVVDVRSASDRHIWVYELERGTRTRLTTEGFNLDPLWTPDGERITFRSHRAGSGAGALYWTLADGSGVPEPLHADKISGTPGAWSPGADRLVFTTMPARRQWILDFVGGGSLSRLFPTEPGAGFPAFSPDGRFVAYVSNESGRDEIFVRAYPGPAGKWPVSAAGGQEPVWAPHGRELFYRNRDVMMAVAVTTEPTFSSEAPRPLFRGSYDRSDNGHQHFDVSPDGETFAMISSEDMASTSEIRIVLDWLPELEQLPATQN